MTISHELKVSPLDYYSTQFPGLVARGSRAMVRCAFHNERTASMSLDLSSGRYKCFGCGEGGDLIDFHMHLTGLDFLAARAELCGDDWAINRVHSKPVPPEPRVFTKPEALQKVWASAVPITPDDPAGKYLLGRQLAFTKFPSTLRFMSRLPYFDSEQKFIGHYAAMIAAVQHSSGAVIALHRTYLTINGDKLRLVDVDGFKARKIYGPTIENGLDGSAIRLHKPGPSLAIGEGIETVLAYSQLFDVPGWAALTAGGLQKIQIPDHVATVHICQDNDEAGRKAANALRQRLEDLGKIVITNPLPEAWTATKGADWNDVLREKNFEQYR